MDVNRVRIGGRWYTRYHCGVCSYTKYEPAQEVIIRPVELVSVHGSERQAADKRDQKRDQLEKLKGVIGGS
jgi:hypothetical protein